MPKSIKNFTKEREEVLLQMLTILGITEENKMFSLQKLDEDEELKTFSFFNRWCIFKKI